MGTTTRRRAGARPGVEGLEGRALLAAGDPLLTTVDVAALLARAAAASASTDGIIAVVDRNGSVLGVRVESGVSTAITGNWGSLVFAVDGALSKARSGAFFANDQAPLTSRTVQFISQSTITQREVDSNPSITDEASTLRGPGFVAPVGRKAHFPPRVRFTPAVDLFAIEHTNRDSLVHPGPDRVKGTADDVVLPARFNADPAFIPAGTTLVAPESYGLVSGLAPGAQARGVGTLPGGMPVFKDGKLVGGIGVFFPGTTGFASAENSALNDDGLFDRRAADRSAEAEWIAFAAAGGSAGAGARVGALGGVPRPAGFDLPFGRIDLVGITLDIYGPGGTQGPRSVLGVGRRVGRGNAFDGVNLPVTAGADSTPGTGDEPTLLPGAPAPDGWLVLPHDGVGLTATDVIRLVSQGLEQAARTRAAIRLPLDRPTRMTYAVTDTTGALLGLYRTPDATTFSTDVAVAKARNTSYYADPSQLRLADQIGGLPAGVAFSSRTFRYTALPYFPEGQDNFPPGPFSILNDGGNIPGTARSAGAPLPAFAFQSVQGYDAFHPQTNFRDDTDILNQNGVVFFPGGVPLYKDIDGDGLRDLVGGLGVSGDGVDQDDVVTAAASTGYEPPRTVLRADQVFVRGIRLPYQKFNRQPLLDSARRGGRR